MNDDSNQAPEDGTRFGDPGSRKVVSAAARRRLIKGGLSAAPVILTLTSRPVLGFENACLAPSRMISGNHSGLSGVLPCGGAARSSYVNSKPESGAFAQTMSFSSVFLSGPPYTGIEGNNDPTLGQVFDDSYPENTVASYLIAALWNVADPAQNITVLTPSQIIHMWNGVNSGGYCPQGSQAGLCWNAEGVIGYLTNSGIVSA